MGKRILACGEFTQLSTGYAVYMRGLLTRLQAQGHQICELACACSENDPRIKNVSWEIVPNVPTNNPEAVKIYQSTPGADFGAWQFESVVNQWRPDVVIDIRDPWHLEFILRSPLRDYFSTVIMPAVDAVPQNKQWLSMYSKADAILSYTDWGIDVMNEAGLGIRTIGSTPPLIDEVYKPMDKAEMKNLLGIGDKKVIGMVGRNQKRKLFPELIEAFAEFSKDNPDVYLYLHTKFPDRGWALDEELLKYGVTHKVLFTYFCQNCGNIEASLFKGANGPCYRCGFANSSTMVDSGLGIPNSELAKIYNCFDLYVQWATNEGYGIPVAEAAACGVPIVGIDYSAMSEVIKNAGGVGIKPLSFHKEIETGRELAVPDNKALVEYFKKFFSLPSTLRARQGTLTRMNYLKNWSEEACYGNWYKAIDGVKPRKPWNAPPNLHRIPDKLPEGMNHKQVSDFLIKQVLNRPEYLGSEMQARIVKDLNEGFSAGGFGGQYWHELSAFRLADGPSRYIPFDQKAAFDAFVVMAKNNEYWEKARVGIQ